MQHSIPSIQVLDKNGLPFVRVFYSIQYPISSIDWSHDGRYLAAAVSNQTSYTSASEGGVKIFDTTSTDPTSRYKTDGSGRVLFHPTEPIICTHCKGVLNTFEYTSGKSKRVCSLTRGPFSILSFSTDGESIILSTKSGVCFFYYILCCYNYNYIFYFVIYIYIFLFFFRIHPISQISLVVIVPFFLNVMFVMQ